MAKLTTVQQHNAHFAEEQHEGVVSVFAGATKGIGTSTLARMATMLHKSTFYILGRSAKRFQSQVEKLKNSNSSCNFVFIETDVSLLSDVDAACKQITSSEKKVDYLYMSAGLVPLNGPEYTREGLETCFALSYYARMRMVSNLLPLLRQSPNPRVLSVLNGGREKKMYDDDLGLEKHWAIFTVVNHSTTMTSLAFEYLARNDQKITFLHAYPGLVQTDIIARMAAPESSGMMWRFTLASFRGLMALLMMVVGLTVEESGERHAFHLTSDTYGPGAHRIGETSDEVTAGGVFEQYRERGWPEKVWEHTVRTFDQILATK
ncbi:hypothetical protein H2202_002843 [Exophiala xenobiotica]|nr:hypothetical protein H2202_002843 [Exophiala xenobiotica]KAK5207883.1 hypothetical protein LTR41_006395 [Exophiala xenobiotica]KAK5219960.1 hypothetical protein LTR72_007491 [Exophiala xenobiotica]KAK5233023.1 hypothetical protein LTR47_005887 [Exophiala xenobiotica]KAK5292777.1 hypothetical protein LTR14_005126 [Exophiala xenobiotica]